MKKFKILRGPAKGKLVLAKPDGKSPISYTNRTQAEKVAKNIEGKVVKGSRAFYVELPESVELGEAWVLASDDLNAVKKTAQKLAKQSPDLTYYVVKFKVGKHAGGKQLPKYEVYQSVDWHIARGHGAKKVVGYGANVDMRS